MHDVVFLESEYVFGLEKRLKETFLLGPRSHCVLCIGQLGAEGRKPKLLAPWVTG